MIFAVYRWSSCENSFCRFRIYRVQTDRRSRGLFCIICNDIIQVQVKRTLLCIMLTYSLVTLSTHLKNLYNLHYIVPWTLGIEKINWFPIIKTRVYGRVSKSANVEFLFIMLLAYVGNFYNIKWEELYQHNYLWIKLEFPHDGCSEETDFLTSIQGLCPLMRSTIKCWEKKNRTI